MKMLAVKKDKLKELTKFGFVEEKNFYTYCESNSRYRYTVSVPSFWEPILSITEYDIEDIEESTTTYIPDVILELIEAGMVESYE